MAKQLLRLRFLLYPLLLLLPCFSLLTSAASNYTILINCGSSVDVSDQSSGRNFVGDETRASSSSSFNLTRRGNSAITNSALKDTSQLYQTARVFSEESEYELDVSDHGNTTYLVRLHFFPFASGADNLSSSTFNVLASPSFTLLKDFTPGNFSSFPVIRELYVYLGAEATKLGIHFVPSSGLAFVNAMEVIRLPVGYLSNGSFSGNGSSVELLSNAYRNVYRVNVGGGKVNDSYWREWTPDDDGYELKSSSTLSLEKSISQAVSSSGDDFVARDDYYKTCRYLNQTANQTERIFWRFSVARETRHLLRAHFCDIVSIGYISSFFHFYIYGNETMDIDLSEAVPSAASQVPFWKDYVVDSDGSGFLNVSIGTGNGSGQTGALLAFLNGLEVMEFVEVMGSVIPDLVDDDADAGPSKKFPYAVVGSVVGALVVVSLLVLVFVWRMRWSKRAKTGREPEGVATNGRTRPRDSYRDGTMGNVSPIPNLNLKLKMAFGEILDATESFDAKLLIGEGGFGKVYKGTLRDGTKVAVKRSDSSHGQGLPEFRTEVIVLSKIRHRHLVSLIGYCDEGSEMILVYEYMEKGTLREHLYNWKDDMKLADRKSELNWAERLEICLGSAKGLHYLHTGADGGIIHRDVKSTNILLDEYLVAKVADFGLSQAGPQDPEHFSTGVKGSFGYLDPEYFRTLQLTDKSDVYAFGVVLLEVLCARPAIVRSATKEEINLAEWGLHWLSKGELENIIDPSLAGQIKPSSLRKFGEIAEKCLRHEGADRPTMLDVCWDLEYALQLQKTAVPRAPHDDSTTGASSNLILPVGDGLSTMSIDVDLDGPFSEGEEDSQTTTSGVFSQLNVHGGR